MNKEKLWAVYGRLADGGFVVVESKFALWCTRQLAQANADALAATHNKANAQNPITHSWVQELTSDVLPTPKDPRPSTTKTHEEEA